MATGLGEDVDISEEGALCLPPGLLALSGSVGGAWGLLNIPGAVDSPSLPRMVRPQTAPGTCLGTPGREEAAWEQTGQAAASGWDAIRRHRQWAV